MDMDIDIDIDICIYDIYITFEVGFSDKDCI